MRKAVAVLCALICLISFGFSSSADVISTKEPASGDRIYIAGNPELYPLEYYNAYTGRYEGILPQIYETVSKETGIQFAYICSGDENRMKELAENGQVEIVSAHFRGDISLPDSVSLFSYNKDGGNYTVCIGFTKIADGEMKDKVKKAVAAVSSGQWLSAAMTLSGGGSAKSAPFYLYIIIAVLCAALAAVILYLLFKRRESHGLDRLRMVDEVTDIGNLLYFEDRFKKIDTATQSLYYVAYMAADINTVENYYGREQAEEIQRYTANVITGSGGDNDFAARIGSGVFVICYMAPDIEQAKVRMTEVAEAVNVHSETLSKDNETVFRIGIYPLGREQIPLETAVNNARQGYLSAVQQRQDVCICDENVLGRAALKSRLQKSLASAIENGEFGLYLQFIYDVRKHTLTAAEVLSRWDNKLEGILAPSKYIDDMKNAGIISEFDFYIFEKTCELLQSWRGTAYEAIRLSCNFTRITMSSSDFVSRLEGIISKYSFDRNHLVVELTEDYIASDAEAAYKNIYAIKNTGCKVALDDFGSGYTSFSDLCDYPIDIIKIDRNIVEKSSDSRGSAVLAGIIRLAHDLKIEVLCEGVETDVQDGSVKQLGCDYIQGFMYSRVLPLESAIKFYDKKTGK